METNAQPHIADISLDVNSPAQTSVPAKEHEHHVKLYKHGHKVGSFIAHNWCQILIWAAFIVAFICLIYLFAITVDAKKRNAGVTLMQVGAHYRCRGTKGCGPDCPFIDHDDPRMEIKEHAHKIQNILDKMRDMQKLTSSSVCEELSDMNQRKIIDSAKAEVSAFEESQKICLVNVSAANIAAQQLAASVAGENSISKRIVDVNNRIRALESVVAIQAIAFSALIIQTGSTITMYRILDISNINRARIDNFDEQVFRAKSQVVDISKIMDNEIIPFVRSSTDAASQYAASLAIITSPQSESGDVVGAMAFFMNTADSFRNKVSVIAGKHNAIQKIFAKCSMKIEGFNNTLPGKIESSDVSKMIENNDYNDALIKTALEPEIIKNQMKFAKERSSFDSGGGVPSVRDDDNDVIPWVGLFGRPSYRRSDGTSAEATSKVMELKSIPSDVPDQLERNTITTLRQQVFNK